MAWKVEREGRAIGLGTEVSVSGAAHTRTAVGLLYIFLALWLSGRGGRLML